MKIIPLVVLAMVSMQLDLVEQSFPQGIPQRFNLTLTNTESIPAQVMLELTGDITSYLALDRSELVIPPGSSIRVGMRLDPRDPGSFRGELSLISGDYRRSIPIAFSVFELANPPINLKIKQLEPYLDPGDTLVFVISLESGLRNPVELDLSYWLESKGRIVVKDSKTYQLQGNQDVSLSLKIPEHIPPGDYLLVVQASKEWIQIKDLAEISIGLPWKLANYLVISLALAGSGYWMRRAYIKFKHSRARYPLGKIIAPEGQLFLGRILGSKSRLMFPYQDLRNHLVISGAAGTGKSLAAMVIAEELLDRGIPVVVVDSSSRWTGFLRPCSDPSLLKLYRRYKIPRKRARGYATLIQRASPQNFDIDFSKAELRIYLTDSLPEDRIQEFYEIGLNSILERYPPSNQLRLVMVWEEINKLIQKEEGIRILERALRELRSRGVGLILTLPLIAGLPEEIKTNIKTEFQFHTKSMAELERIERTYGNQYLKYISGAGIGVCMVHNPEQNLGKPYFLEVRPSYHHPYSLSRSELDCYLQLMDRICKLRSKIPPEKLWDLEQALDRLKNGRIELARMYIDSMEKA